MQFYVGLSLKCLLVTLDFKKDSAGPLISVIISDNKFYGIYFCANRIDRPTDKKKLAAAFCNFVM